IEEVAQQPLPGMIAPGDFAFSPDDRLLTFLWSPQGSLTRQLCQLDPATGEQRLLAAAPGAGVTEEPLSIEEQLRRERQRQVALGITEYTWAKRANRILVPLAGEVYVQDGPDAPLRRVVGAGEAPTQDAQISPDGAWVAFVRAGEIFVVDAGGTP